MARKIPQKPPKKIIPFPTKEEILEFIQESLQQVGKREIARAFHVRGDMRAVLKDLLREMEKEGSIDPGRRRRYGGGALPPVAMLEVTGTDLDGEVLARPLTWDEEDGAPPVIYMMPERRGHPALGAGDRVLARLKKLSGEAAYEGRTIRRITSAPPQVLGVFGMEGGEGRLKPTDKRAKGEYLIARDNTGGAKPGELVWAEVLPGRRLGLRQAKVVDCLGGTGGVSSISMIAIHGRDIPYTFTAEALDQAREAAAAPLDGRQDLRAIPLVTIDGADARDFDDAVWAEADGDGKNPGGWRLMVAIADVSWYVRPGGALDRCAHERGNSVYFPDRVVPMLPEDLSNGWCSLNPDEDRPCLAAHMWIDAKGELLRHKFVRGIMRSHARLTYTQAEEFHNGKTDETTGPRAEKSITPLIGNLYGAYRALEKVRRKRGVLDLDLPERRIVMAADGTVARVEERERLDSHRLIEEFMITANVAAARELERLRQPCMYRVHDQPSREKIEALAQFLESVGIPFARGQVVKPARFNRILSMAKDTPNARMVSEVVLRSQAQAEYAPENIGHFGLALTRYCHFTSPIRRYSDLLVHRALIAGLKLGRGGLEKDHEDFTSLGEHLSDTERRAAAAERDAVDRFTAAFLADRIGAAFKGRINGVTRFGLFVTLDETGADGLVPMGALPGDYYVHDEARHLLRGRDTGREYRLGEEVEVILAEANPITGGMIMHLLDGPQSGERKKTKAKIRKRAKPSPKRRRG